MKYKKWSLEEKLEILSFSEELGVVETYRKYSVSTGTLYSWKKKHEKHEKQGETGLKVTYDTSNKELKQAEEENRILRKLLANKEIEI
jgi:putative transposase